MALLAAFSLPALLGLIALALDLGRAYVLRAELQNAMDACALAASSALVGLDDAQVFDEARSRALALSDAQALGLGPRPAASVNRVGFQQDALDPQRLEVAFARTLDGPFVAATAAQTQGLPAREARYVRCRYQDAERDLWMLPVLRAWGIPTPTGLNLQAQAVAALAPASTLCAVPIAVCAVPGQTAGQQWGLRVGQRLASVDQPGDGYTSGRFGWVDFSPPYGGASELSSLLEGAGACGIRRGQPVGQPGQVNSIRRAWNTRFGLYNNARQASQAPPDYTGYGFTEGEGHLAAYLARRQERAAFQGEVGNGVVALTAQQHAQQGQQRRLATAPVVNCSVWNGGNHGARPTVLDWACVLMLAPVKVSNRPSGAGVSDTIDIEYLGLAGQPGAPCSTHGAVGGDTGPAVPGLVQ